MKITHPSGETYDLNPGTRLEFTRSNPFFSELGEQTIPLSLPATPKNLRLMANPDRPENRSKIPARIDATIQSGIFTLNARQAVLSAQTGESIQTSFYINTGALYERAKNISLMDLFADKVVQFASVDAAITFVRSLMITPDPRFAVFQVVTENYIINQFGTAKADGYASLHKELSTIETIDGKQVSVPKGFYISPFIKVKHLLQEVLAEMGYTLAPSFLDNEPFSSMVFLNDTLDTIVDAEIRYIDVVPNIMASTLLEILRKFNIEILPDEDTKTVRLIHFDQMLSAPPARSLTKSVDGHPVVNYHHNYRQLMLSSESMNLPELIKPFSYKSRWGTFATVNTSTADTSFIETVSRYPGAYLDPQTGELLHQAFRGETELTQIVGTLASSYYAGGILSAEQMKFPDTIPPLIFDFFTGATFPYAGSGRFLHSNIVFSDDSQSDLIGESELRPMLCFRYFNATLKYDIGTTANYNFNGTKLWDYTLQWNGEYGIFEKFWRNRDKLLRNALLQIDFNLLLSENDKFTIRPTDKININGSDYLIAELKYTPEEQAAQTCRFLSMRMQEPISQAKPAASYLQPRTYKWKLNSSRNFTINPPQQTREEIKYKTTPVTILPPPPTAAQFNAGGQYHQKTYQVEYGYVEIGTGAYTKVGDGTITTWLTPAIA